MGIAEWYITNVLPRPGGRGAEFARPGKAISAGIWGIPFVIFYLISLALLVAYCLFQPFTCLLCLPLLLVVAVVPAAAMTAGLWLCWNVLLSIWPSTGLKIGYEIGRFRLLPEEGWKLAKHLLKRQLALDLTSSSPHILIIGGSQTGKSATIKTILTRLMEKPKCPALEALHQSAIPLLAVLAILFLLFRYLVLALTPIMLIIYFLQSGHMTQTGVYAGFGVLGIVIFAIVGVLAWHVKGRYGSIMAAMQQNTRNVILDFHGEYGFLADNGFAVIDARDYNPLAPNYEGEQFEHIVSDFVDAFLVAFETAGEVQLAILKKNLEQKREIRAAR
jgi:DNA helicase HerA-like ATPase